MFFVHDNALKETYYRRRRNIPRYSSSLIAAIMWCLCVLLPLLALCLETDLVSERVYSDPIKRSFTYTCTRNHHTYPERLRARLSNIYSSAAGAVPWFALHQEVARKAGCTSLRYLC